MSAEAEVLAADTVEKARIKRRRVPIACTTCRARKTRCDGTRPKCDSCVEMGEECTFIQPQVNNDVQINDSRQSSELIKRLDKIEAAMKGTLERNPFGFHPGEQPTVPNGSLKGMEDESPFSDGSIPRRMSTKRDYAGFQEGNSDGLAAVTTSSDDEDELEDGEGPYYGPSSNITLIKQISSALFRTQAVREWHQIHLLSDRRPRSKRFSVDDPEALQDAESFHHQAIDPYELPPLHEAQAYISHFFSQVAMFLSCLHQKSFIETFRRHRANLQQGKSSGVSKVWLGILNLVFAISRTTMEGNTPDANKLAACEIFYQRAIKLAWERALRGRSVEIVQFLHLKSTFLQGTERSFDVWATHSFAINAAYSIGLHTAEHNSALSPLEKEVRTRTWYCLLIDDNTLSTAWGRPALAAGVVPQTINPLTADTGFYPANVSKVVASLISSYLTSTVSLGIICQDTINDLFDHNRNSATTLGVYETISRTNEICWRLNKWKESLPEALQPPRVGEVLSWEAGPELPITRLRCFLSLRYQNQHITAYRAVLSRFLDESSTSINSQGTYEPMCRIGIGLLHDCVRCCVSIIENVLFVIRASEKQTTINGAWWLFSYYLFNATLVLCGIIISLPKQTDDNRLMSEKVLEDAREAFGRGVEVMKELDRGSAVVSRCCGVLNRFAELLGLSRMQEDNTATSVLTDDSTTSSHNPSHNNMYQPYSGGNDYHILSLTKDHIAGEGMMFPTDEEFEKVANNGFGFDGFDYLLENLGSDNNALNFM